MTGFTEDSAARVARATKQVEHWTRGDRSHRGRYMRAKGVRAEVGKLDAQMSYQGTVVVSIWRWNGSAMADAGYNITANDWLLSSGQTIASGKQVVIMRIAGRWLVIEAQCA